MREAKYAPADVSEVVLVGGSTRVPKVQEQLRDLLRAAIVNHRTTSADIHAAIDAIRAALG